MAERLPRYRPLGVRIPGVPSVNYVQGGNAEARVFETMSAALDQMTEFTFERAKTKTIREARKYAFDNPVTPEQIQAAKRKGVDLDDIIGDPDTVFGATLRATTGQMMRANLEGTYRSQVGILQKMVEAEDWRFDDPEKGTRQIQTQLAALEDGYFDALKDVDADEALAFKATAATLGSAVYKSALEKENKLRILDNRTTAQGQLDQFPAAMRAHVAQFDGNVKNLEEQLDKEIASMRSTLNATGDITFAETSGATLFDEKKNAKIDVLVGHALEEGFAASDLNRAGKIRRGEFGRYSKLYQSLDEDGKAEVRKRVREENTARKQEDDRQQQDNDRTESSNVVAIAQQMDAGTLAVESGINQLYVIAGKTNQRVITISTIRALDKDLTEGSVSNATGNLNMRLAIANGEVTQDNFEEKRVEFGVTAKDALPMVGTMMTQDRQEEANVLRIGKRTAGVLSDVQQISDQQATDIERFYRNVGMRHADKVREWEAGGKVGRKPTRIDVARDLQAEFIANGYTQDISETVTQMQSMLSSYNIQDFFTEYTTEQDIEELEIDAEEKVVRRLKSDLKAALKRIEKARDQRELYF